MSQERRRDRATPPRAQLLDAAPDHEVAKDLSIRAARNPLANGTLGDIGIAARVAGPDTFAPTILVQPLDRPQGVDPATIRFFRSEPRARALRPVWSSGVNPELGFAWAMIERPGVYVPIGLPQDKLLLGLLSDLARERLYADAEDVEGAQERTRQALDVFLEAPEEDLDELRQLLALLELQTGPEVPESEIRRGKGAGILPPPLPGGMELDEFRERLGQLQVPARGLPEETLFFRPEAIPEPAPPWPLPGPRPFPWPGIPPFVFERLSLLEWILRRLPPFILCLLLSRDWWMYHHDERLSGVASGCSGIRRTSVAGLVLRSSLTLNGPVISVPVVVGGKVYVGTGRSSAAALGSGGTLYKIDLTSGAVDATFTFNTSAGAGSRQGYSGIGSSPAVVGGRVYVSGLDGKLYCLDAGTLTPIWTTNLRTADTAHKQPVTHLVAAEGWSSPLVVKNRVYVGFGEGESNTFGYVYCLDANTGNVIWLFCTNLFAGVADNSPNVVPSSHVGMTLPSGFSSRPDPAQRGSSPWSSCAYDAVLDRIYIGTGNAQPDDPLPDPKYASGVLSLDATTGAFRGFFQPTPADSYRPTEIDVDIPAGPTIFRRGAANVLFIGSKSGSGFLLDPATMNVLARRQLLPRDAAGNPLPGVDPPAFFPENEYGVFGTAAVHFGLGRLFVGLGGYWGAIDYQTTPFLRAVDWTNLNDAWATAVGADGVSRYTTPRPPMYTTANESGLSSPAVVNDVVFVATTKPGLYALDAATGLCLWSAPGLGPAAFGTYVMGPAIYGNSVVVGASNAKLNIYSL